MLGSGLRALFRFQMLDVGGERLGTRDVLYNDDMTAGFGL